MTFCSAYGDVLSSTNVGLSPSGGKVTIGKKQHVAVTILQHSTSPSPATTHIHKHQRNRIKVLVEEEV